MEKDNGGFSELASLYFELLNPYKGGAFTLRRTQDPECSSDRPSSSALSPRLSNVRTHPLSLPSSPKPVEKVFSPQKPSIVTRATFHVSQLLDAKKAEVTTRKIRGLRRDHIGNILIKCGKATYIRQAVNPNSDCGYTAFGIDRHQAYTFLIDNINSIRDIIKPIIREILFANEDFINSLSDDYEGAKRVSHDYYSALLRKDSNLNLFVSDLEKLAEDLNLINVYIDYDVRDRRVDDGWCHPLILYALAHIRGLHLQLYEIVDNREEMVLHRVYPGYSPENANDSVQLLFIHRNQFERVELSTELHSELSSSPDCDVTNSDTSKIISHSSPDVDFSYWNEILFVHGCVEGSEGYECSGLFLGMQPTKSNHPFLLDNPDYLAEDVNSCPFLLNPTLFSQEDIAKKKIRGCVFTFQEIYETNGDLIGVDTFLDHNIFHQFGIINKWLPMSDHSAKVSEQLALYRLYDMMDCYLNCIPIYLQCKSGKSRSAEFMVLFLSFCFLLEKRSSYDKQICVEKRMRLIKMVERISRAGNVVDLFSIAPDEKPNEKTLELLFKVCEFVVRQDRKIKISAEQRKSGISILGKLSECLYGVENTAHPNSRLPNIAFIDELTQTCVLKNIHVHMDGLLKNEDISCKSFQEFLMRLVYNLDGWYEELIEAIEGRHLVRGECGYFLNVSNEAVREERMGFLLQLRNEVEALVTKFPSSDYARDFTAKQESINTFGPP